MSPWKILPLLVAIVFLTALPARSESDPVSVREYVVQEGDSLSIVLRYEGGLTREQITPAYMRQFRRMNPHIRNLDHIEIGDRLVIPLPDATHETDDTDDTTLSRPNSSAEADQGYVSRVSARLAPKDRKSVSMAQAWKDRPIDPVTGASGKVMFVFGASMPTLVCSPLQPTDLELQPGELVNEIFLGDTARWVVSAGRSGPAPERTHLIFKPFDAGLETTAVITTDRRTYHIRLVSDPTRHISYAGFAYPEEQMAALQAQLAATQREEKWESVDTAEVTGKSVRLSDLDFGYEVTGDDTSWRPTQVFNDGASTIIRLPDTVSQTDMPVLLVEQSGEKALVNYRTKGTTLIVDGLFERAVLLSGVGKKQKKVTIRRLATS